MNSKSLINQMNQERKAQNSKSSILKINCQECDNFSRNIYNDQCISCISKKIYEIKNGKTFQCISLPRQGLELNYQKIICFQEFHKILGEIESIIIKLENLRGTCEYIDHNCLIFDNFLPELKITDKIFNPLFLYELVNKALLNKKERFNERCEKCFNSFFLYLKSIHNKLKKLNIISQFDYYIKKKDIFGGYANFYEFLLSPLIISEDPNTYSDLKSQNFKTVNSYYLKPHQIYKIQILGIKKELEKVYLIKSFFDENIEKDFYKRIIKYCCNNLEFINTDKLLTIEDLIENYRVNALKIIDRNFKLSKLNKNRIAFLISLKKIRLDKLFPLFIDDYIEEIFYDSPLDIIYLNHQKYGRCRTLLKLDSIEIERLKTLLRLYSGQRLDLTNPSLKTIIKNKYFYCRFTVDISPINFNGFSFDIRKLNKYIYTIQDLLKNKTLNSRIAAFLFFCISNRINITVAGETDSGKTTLINSLDLLLPKNFRKIYIENIIESLNENKFGMHQLKFKVNSLDDKDPHKIKKSDQIKKLLHRTPDFIYLGEVLTKEETEAMFHCLAAGLRGFQTIHARDISSLINRFLYHFEIKKPCLKDLDIIVLMKKDQKNNRKIFSISELSINQNSEVFIEPIVLYDSQKSKWIIKKDFYNSRIISRNLQFDYITRLEFNEVIESLDYLFSRIKISSKLKIEQMVLLFNEVSLFLRDSTSSIRINQSKKYFKSISNTLI